MASAHQLLNLATLQLQLNTLNVKNTINVAHIQHNQRRRRRRRRRRTVWVRLWLQRRSLHGQFEQLMEELQLEDPAAFKNFMRMEPAMFHELLTRLAGRLTKLDTNYRKALPPGLKLAITLRFLASGDSYHSLMYGFRVAHNTISLVIREVCQAIVEELGEEVVKTPTTPEDWKVVAEQFRTRWQFPHALGAIDGKHIAIKCPKNSGSIYYNYKGFYSVVLLGLVDADYKFIWVDIGSNGCSSDAQIFNDCQLREGIEDGSIGLPAPENLPSDDRPVPYFLVGDDAFALKTWMMKPFSKRNISDEERIFNYRLSRARRIVENAFGILANRFQCLLTTLKVQPQTVSSIVSACVCLHNVMHIRYPTLHTAVLDQHAVIPGDWRRGGNLQDMDNIVGGNRASGAAKAQRLYLKH